MILLTSVCRHLSQLGFPLEVLILMSPVVRLFLPQVKRLLFDEDITSHEGVSIADISPPKTINRVCCKV